MDAGRLKERVAFDLASGTPNGRGGTVTSWTQQFSCAAGFTWLRGGESVMAGRLVGRQTVVIRVRRAASTTGRITADWRGRDLRTGEVFAVRSIIPAESGSYLDITCETGVAP